MCDKLQWHKVSEARGVITLDAKIESHNFRLKTLAFLDFDISLRIMFSSIEHILFFTNLRYCHYLHQAYSISPSVFLLRLQGVHSYENDCVKQNRF